MEEGRKREQSVVIHIDEDTVMKPNPLYAYVKSEGIMYLVVGHKST